VSAAAVSGIRLLGAAALVASSLAFAPGPAAAQRAHIQISSGPYYQGEPIDVHLIVEDFEESPTPEVEVPPPAGGSIQFVGVSPSTRSSITIINGRMTQTKEVRFVFQYRAIAREPGIFRIGPFRVSQDGINRTTGPVQIQVEELGNSDRVRIKASWPSHEAYPGQRFVVQLEWWLEQELNERMHEYRIVVPIFNRSDLFRFVDSPPQPGETKIVVQTETGPVFLKATVSEREEGGRRFNVVKAERVLVPLRAGSYDLAGATVVVDEVVRWRRDLFGQRTPKAIRKVRSADEKRRLVVLDVPKQGRPESFAGAIGRGFSLEVSTDRSVLQVGDPIELTLVLHGDGNLDGAGLPNLTAGGGLSPDLFRTPSGSQGGVVKDGAKTFRVQVRVLDASVREIPPIVYSYFDTDKKQFATVESRPIALSVSRGQVITAADVVSGAEEPGGESVPRLGRANQPEDDGIRAGDVRSATGELVLTGANLSIVREAELLLAGGAAGTRGTAAVVSIYSLSLAMIVGALAYRRRSDLDPAVVRRDKQFAEERKRITGTAGTPRVEAMSVLAGALRTLLRAASGKRPAGLDALLSECDAVAYAPTGGGAETIAPEVIEQALALAQAIEEGAA
jgi:hypothetical protein